MKYRLPAQVRSTYVPDVCTCMYVCICKSSPDQTVKDDYHLIKCLLLWRGCLFASSFSPKGTHRSTTAANRDRNHWLGLRNCGNTHSLSPSLAFFCSTTHYDDHPTQNHIHIHIHPHSGRLCLGRPLWSHAGRVPMGRHEAWSLPTSTRPPCVCGTAHRRAHSAA